MYVGIFCYLFVSSASFPSAGCPDPQNSGSERQVRGHGAVFIRGRHDLIRLWSSLIYVYTR